jgi:hypothetical protein
MLNLGSICIALWFTVFVLGCLTRKNHHGIGREAFLLAVNGLLFLQLVVLALLDVYSESLQGVGLFSICYVIALCWSAITGYWLATLGTARASGTIGKRSLALLSIIPVANLILALVPMSSPREWRFKPTLRLLVAMLGALTLNVATVIGFLVPAMTSGWRLFS